MSLRIPLVALAALHVLPAKALADDAHFADRELSRCLPFSAGSRNLEACLESRPLTKASRQFAVTVRDASAPLEDQYHHALVTQQTLDLAAEEYLDYTSGGVFELPGGILIWLPIVRGVPGRFVEGHLRLAVFDPAKARLRLLPERLRCLKRCEMQFLSYQSSSRETTLLHEAKTNSQVVRSTYRWNPERGAITPLEIEEAKDLREVTGGKAAPPSKPVCERTPQVRAEIARRTGRSRCAEVTAEDLAGVTFLVLSSAKIDALAPGDFSGMPRLERIELDDNPLRALTPGVFDGLFVLDSLNFQGCALTEIPADAFADLHSLKSLYLNANRIERVAPNAFRGLGSLTFLSLDNNRIAELPEGVFAPLKAPKKNVYLNGNPLRRRK